MFSAEALALMERRVAQCDRHSGAMARCVDQRHNRALRVHTAVTSRAGSGPPRSTPNCPPTTLRPRSSHRTCSSATKPALTILGRGCARAGSAATAATCSPSAWPPPAASSTAPNWTSTA
ncbi:hypothetical protein CKJ66_26255 [Mycobacterium avium]|uniref:Uncharacterized protein n=1 Tax=Mycobacterium avium TaxID=1764 RepID=A0A2A2ZBD5_MYCAV|nr:hypothetical protein CKJ66_26255 [Mycobacterium avium]